MPFAIDPADRQFFHSQGWVQFDQVFSAAEIAPVRDRATRLSRLHPDPLRVYEAGRDLQRHHRWAQKLAQEMGSIAASLWNERPIVLIGDQLLGPVLPANWSGGAGATPPSLEQVWSAQPILGAIVIALDRPLPGSTGRIEQLESASICCLKAATPALAVGGRWLWMLVFGTDQARYVKAAGDPFADAYRQRGIPEQGRIMLARPTIYAR